MFHSAAMKLAGPLGHLESCRSLRFYIDDFVDALDSMDHKQLAESDQEITKFRRLFKSAPEQAQAYLLDHPNLAQGLGWMLQRHAGLDPKLARLKDWLDRHQGR